MDSRMGIILILGSWMTSSTCFGFSFAIAEICSWDLFYVLACCLSISPGDFMWGLMYTQKVPGPLDQSKYLQLVIFCVVFHGMCIRLVILQLSQVPEGRSRWWCRAASFTVSPDVPSLNLAILKEWLLTSPRLVPHADHLLLWLIAHDCASWFSKRDCEV